MSNDKTMQEAIDKDTRITVGAAIACAFALLSAALWVNNRISALEHEVSGLRTLIEGASADRWTQTEMYLWTELLRAKNPGVDIPDIPQTDV